MNKEIMDALCFLHSLAKKDKEFVTQTESFKQVVNYIEDLEVKINNKWIPCEVSLPMPKGEMELYPINYVTLDTGELAIGVYRTDDKVWYTRRLEGETLYTTEHKVIAWQPLPQSYEKEGEIDG